MIVTRRRPKKRNLAPILLPLAAIAALALALAWPPSHKVIVDGPLRPLWNVTGSVTTQVSRPFSFAAQQQQIADKNRDLRARDAALETNRKAQEAKDARISALQSQVTALQAEPKPTPFKARPRPVQTGLGAAVNTAPVPEDIKRTASYWTSMDSEKAAAIVQRLPDPYVNQVFTQMSPDTVAEIMNALPAKVAARLTSSAATQIAPITSAPAQ